MDQIQREWVSGDNEFVVELQYKKSSCDRKSDRFRVGSKILSDKEHESITIYKCSTFRYEKSILRHSHEGIFEAQRSNAIYAVEILMSKWLVSIVLEQVDGFYALGFNQ